MIDKTLLFGVWSIGGLFWLVKKYFAAVLHRKAEAGDIVGEERWNDGRSFEKLAVTLNTHGVAFLRADLGITKSHSRPYQNPLSKPSNTNRNFRIALEPYGRAEQIIKERKAVLDAAYEKNQKRFKGKMPTPAALPETVWINKPASPGSDLALQ